VLTRMTEERCSFSAAVAEAQELGYAEPDPTADIDGFDAASKAAIIASIAFGARVVAGDVSREGIRDITADDIGAAAELGYVVKLLAVTEECDGAVSARVHPAMVPLGHPLAAVRGSFNAVFIEGEAVGQLMLLGRPRTCTRARAARPSARSSGVRSVRSTRPLHSSMFRSTPPTSPVCWRRSPECSASTRCRSNRCSKRARATTPV
jgi:Homoserine dehydrogenase